MVVPNMLSPVTHGTTLQEVSTKFDGSWVSCDLLKGDKHHILDYFTTFQEDIMASHYSLRYQQKKNYKKLGDTKLPKVRPTKTTEKLYELEILEEDTSTGKIKVHYIGYGSEDDEWREKEDIVDTGPPKPGKYIIALYH